MVHAMDDPEQLELAGRPENDSPADRDLRHLHWLKGRIGEDLLDAIVITTGGTAYRREDGIGVVPLALLGP
jgi:uncharacterized protein